MFFLLWIALLWPVCSYGQNTEEALVKACFEGYKQAILTDKGTEAAGMVDSRTMQYYSHLLEMIKTADSAEMRAASLVDRFSVFCVRLKMTREDILQLDGRKLLIYAINSGMVGKNGVVNSTVGTVTVSEDFAKGVCVVDGTPSPLYFHFYKEDHTWKFNITALLPLANDALRNIMDEQGVSEDDLLSRLLQLLTGKKPDGHEWKPVL